MAPGDKPGQAFPRTRAGSGVPGMTYREWLVGQIVPQVEGTSDRRAYRAVEIADHIIRFMAMDQEAFERAERFTK